MNSRRKRPPAKEATPTYNENAERAVIGIALSHPNSFWDLYGKVKTNHFSIPRLGRIWAAISRAAETGKPIKRDYVSLLIQNDSGEDTPIGVLLAVLINESPPASEADIYAETVVHLANKRALLEAMDRARQEILTMDVGSPAEEMKDIGIRTISSAFSGDRDDDMLEYHEWGSRVFDQSVESLRLGENGSLGLSPGLRGVVETIGQLLPGKLYVLAGMAGGGKSALARMIIEAAAKDAQRRNGGFAYIASQEMTGEEYAARALAEQLGLPASDIESGSLNYSQVELIGRAVNDLKRMPIVIDSRPRKTMEDIRARMLKVKNQKGLSIGALDHLLLIKATDPRASLSDRIAESTIEAKNLAKEMGIPMILLTQLDEKGVLDSPAGWPTSRHLFGGQTINMNADVVMFVHRPYVIYEKREPSKDKADDHAKWVDKMDRERNRAYVYTNKRRGGKSGIKSELYFDGPTMTFRDI